MQKLLQINCPEVNVIGSYTNPDEAIEKINILEPDLILLDIAMPVKNGFDLLKELNDFEFEVIFVTAHNQYMIEAFHFSAIDYLLKPVDIERLKLAIARVQQHRNIEQQSQRLALLSNTLKSKQLKNIVISDKGQQNIIPIESIIAIEAQESYCIIHTTEKKIVASKNLKHFEIVLESLPRFIRVHKSWMVNKDHIKNYSKSDLSIQLSNGVTTKLSKYKKAEFEAAISS
jgi:two-component system LytT family response regulator